MVANRHGPGFGCWNYFDLRLNRGLRADVRKMANNLRILRRIQGGHSVIIDHHIGNLVPSELAFDGWKSMAK
jgi:hypothetical protein